MRSFFKELVCFVSTVIKTNHHEKHIPHHRAIVPNFCM